MCLRVKGRCDSPNRKFNRFRRKKHPIAVETAHRSWGPKKDGRNRSNAVRLRRRQDVEQQLGAGD